MVAVECDIFLQRIRRRRLHWHLAFASAFACAFACVDLPHPPLSVVDCDVYGQTTRTTAVPLRGPPQACTTRKRRSSAAHAVAVLTHPLAPSHLSLSRTAPLAAAKRAAANKRRRYEAAATQRADFIPFACESTGGIGQDADDLINQLSLASKDHLTLPSHHPPANSIHSTVAIAITRGVPNRGDVATMLQHNKGPLSTTPLHSTLHLSIYHH